MRKLKTKSGMVAVAILLGLAFILPTATSARNGEDTPTSNAGNANSSSGAGGQSQSGSQAGSEQSSGVKLQAGKLEACQNREKNINAIMARIADRATKQLHLFDQVAERVQTYYRENGVILEDYDALVAQVQAKKQQATAAAQRVKTQSSGFNCGGNDPKGVASQFKTEVQSSITVYKDYRSAISELIAGVKSALEGEE